MGYNLVLSRYCPRGGIGRRAWFRSMCREVWGFESLRGHQQSTRMSLKLVFACEPSGSTNSNEIFICLPEVFFIHQSYPFYIPPLCCTSAHQLMSVYLHFLSPAKPHIQDMLPFINNDQT